MVVEANLDFDDKGQPWEAESLDASDLRDGEYLQVHY
jgi:hypothetical protein